MNYNNSDELCELIANRSGGNVILRFSCGKDAIGAWIQLKRHFNNIIPVYHYLHPNLEFINHSLSYYEKFFGTKIMRVANSKLYKHINSGLLADPDYWQNVIDYNLPNFNNDEVNEVIKEQLGLDKYTMTAIGVRSADSLNRYLSIKKHGAINEGRKTFYPVYDWNIERLVTEIEKSGVKLPIDYKIWGKSFDGLDYRFIKPLKDNFPEDYERLKELYPLIDLEIKRYEN